MLENNICDDNIILMFNYTFGLSVKIDEEKAKILCLNHPENLISLGLRYFMGWDCEKNVSKSEEYFIKSMESPINDGQMGFVLNMMGYFQSTKIDCKKEDIMRGIEHYKKSSEMGNSMGMFNLAYYHLRGKKNFQQNIQSLKFILSNEPKTFLMIKKKH